MKRLLECILQPVFLLHASWRRIFDHAHCSRMRGTLYIARSFQRHRVYLLPRWFSLLPRGKPFTQVAGRKRLQNWPTEESRDESCRRRSTARLRRQAQRMSDPPSAPCLGIILTSSAVKYPRRSMLALCWISQSYPRARAEITGGWLPSFIPASRQIQFPDPTRKISQRSISRGKCAVKSRNRQNVTEFASFSSEWFSFFFFYPLRSSKHRIDLSW